VSELESSLRSVPWSHDQVEVEDQPRAHALRDLVGIDRTSCASKSARARAENAVRADAGTALGTAD